MTIHASHIIDTWAAAPAQSFYAAALESGSELAWLRSACATSSASAYEWPPPPGSCFADNASAPVRPPQREYISRTHRNWQPLVTAPATFAVAGGGTAAATSAAASAAAAAAADTADALLSAPNSALATGGSTATPLASVADLQSGRGAGAPGRFLVRYTVTAQDSGSGIAGLATDPARARLMTSLFASSKGGDDDGSNAAAAPTTLAGIGDRSDVDTSSASASGEGPAETGGTVGTFGVGFKGVVLYASKLRPWGPGTVTVLTVTDSGSERSDPPLSASTLSASMNTSTSSRANASVSLNASASNAASSLGGTASKMGEMHEVTVGAISGDTAVRVVRARAKPVHVLANTRDHAAVSVACGAGQRRAQSQGTRVTLALVAPADPAAEGACARAILAYVASQPLLGLVPSVADTQSVRVRLVCKWAFPASPSGAFVWPQPAVQTQDVAAHAGAVAAQRALPLPSLTCARVDAVCTATPNGPHLRLALCPEATAAGLLRLAATRPGALSTAAVEVPNASTHVPNAAATWQMDEIALLVPEEPYSLWRPPHAAALDSAATSAFAAALTAVPSQVSNARAPVAPVLMSLLKSIQPGVDLLAPPLQLETLLKASSGAAVFSVDAQNRTGETRRPIFVLSSPSVIEQIANATLQDKTTNSEANDKPDSGGRECWYDEPGPANFCVNYHDALRLYTAPLPAVYNGMRSYLSSWVGTVAAVTALQREPTESKIWTSGRRHVDYIEQPHRLPEKHAGITDTARLLVRKLCGVNVMHILPAFYKTFSAADSEHISSADETRPTRDEELGDASANVNTGNEDDLPPPLENV